MKAYGRDRTDDLLLTMELLYQLSYIGNGFSVSYFYSGIKGLAGTENALYNTVHFIPGWSSPAARKAHNLEVAGSNPAPGTH